MDGENMINKYFKLLSGLVSYEHEEYIQIIYGNAWEFQFHEPHGTLYEIQQRPTEPIEEVFKRFLVKVKHYKLTKKLK